MSKESNLRSLAKAMSLAEKFEAEAENETIARIFQIAQEVVVKIAAEERERVEGDQK